MLTILNNELYCGRAVHSICQVYVQTIPPRIFVIFDVHIQETGTEILHDGFEFVRAFAIG